MARRRRLDAIEIRGENWTHQHVIHCIRPVDRVMGKYLFSIDSQAGEWEITDTTAQR